MYTTAFRRLSHVTQVVGADENYVFHNRLTHSLQVAQVSRRIAELILKLKSCPDICPDVCESAGLAHDLGHPPFGHVAEEELDKAARAKGLRDGFEGNAQSFRIVTKLASAAPTCNGLDLTRATLNAILKYPWMRGKNPNHKRKWGAYNSEKDDFSWCRELSISDEAFSPSLEAQIMDWADDITYSVHDVEDFYRAGIVPLDRLGQLQQERDSFYDDVFVRNKEFLPKGIDEARARRNFESLAKGWKVMPRYQGSFLQRQVLRSMSSKFIGEYVTHTSIYPRNSDKAGTLRIPTPLKLEVFMLKQLTWSYVIRNPALAHQQHGQRKIIRELFNIYSEAAMDKTELEYRLFPLLFRERLMEKDISKAARLRIVLDLISSLTEQQATSLHHKLHGTAAGSPLLHPIR